MLVRLIAAAGLCGRDVGWGCDRLIAATRLCGRDVIWGTTDPTKHQKRHPVYTTGRMGHGVCIR